MRRRDFFIQSLSAGTGLGASLLMRSGRVLAQETAQNRKTTPQMEKVKMAMLSMQRASWEQGVAATALMEMGESDMVVLMAKEAVLRQGKDGRFALLGSGGNVTDPAANGEAVLFAAKHAGESALLEASDRMLDYLMNKAPKTQKGILYHLVQKPQVWADSMFMAPPFLAAAGQPAEAVKQIDGMCELLLDPQKKLFSHIWDDGAKIFADKEFWGVGNGWAAAGLTRVLQYLPESMDVEKKKLAGTLKRILDGCLAYIRQDGLFHNIVDKPESFTETNLSQMLAYSIYTGTRGGWMDKSYLPVAEKMRKAVQYKVNKYGLVLGVCGSPNFDRPGTATEGQAFFLMMEAASMSL